jgi:uncharacterized membrane protein
MRRQILSVAGIVVGLVAVLVACVLSSAGYYR